MSMDLRDTGNHRSLAMTNRKLFKRLMGMVVQFIGGMQQEGQKNMNEDVQDHMSVSDKKLTTREQIIRCLEAEPMTARDLSKALRISEKDAYSHLPSITKSIKHQGKQIKIMPCYCLSCGFEFKDRKSFKKPGKCPECRKSRIEASVFQIVGG
jgi:transcriptional regulator